MRNAFSGYTYQQQVTLLLLTIMDVERKFSKVQIEANTSDDFDDLTVYTSTESFHIQIKDFENTSFDDIKIQDDKILIKQKSHILSSKINIIFFKEIIIEPNEKILNLPSYKLANNIFIISLSRTQIDTTINNLLKNNPHRKNELEYFFNSILDKRIWEISIDSLPNLKVFITELQEKSILISNDILKFQNILLIEGKPGVGKSHFVNTLTENYKNNILYRFWIGNQDRDYNERLQFNNFIRDLNTKLFYDQKERTQKQLFSKLKEENKILIIDGLDHIENYNNSDLENFINFINSAKKFCKIIVLSRPLFKELNWRKHTLDNWNLTQTEKVLKTLFHVNNYLLINEIFRISQGYPIIVKYLAEHYKIHKVIPNIEQVEDIDFYYQKVISNEKGKQSLALFLCSKSYLMKSEIELFIGEEKLFVNEFINEHPYLFDIKLNRISLFHDSFNNFLRKQINYQHKVNIVNKIVCDSILEFNNRFLSRFALFELPIESKKKILIRYASINAFEKILKNTIDYESIVVFYTQLRESIIDISADDLNINNYYDLSLIINSLTRDHLSTINTFYYTYVKSLIANGFTDEDITSSGYLFGMYYYVKTKNAILLHNKTNNDLYDTEYFYSQLENDIYEEENFFAKHSEKITKSTIDNALADRINFKKSLTHILENIYIHKSNIKGYEDLYSCILEFINGDSNNAEYLLEKFLLQFNTPHYYANWILNDSFNNLLSYGYKVDEEKNEFQDLTLNNLIKEHAALGSFNLRFKIHNYIRLALFENRKIDIQNIYPYWTKYYQRKDYTLYSLPIALKTLTNEGLITISDCVNLIHKIQTISEKGYRNILTEFIELFPPKKVISYLEKHFEIEDLHINWFHLPPKFINKISERIYNFEENKLIENHNGRSVPFWEIKNVLYSNKFEKIELTLNLFKIKVTFKNGQSKSITKFKNSKIRFEELSEENYTRKNQKSIQRFKNGILTYKDINFIKKKKLKPFEVVKFSDDFYTSIPNLKIFEIYPQSQINQHFKEILYNSLTSKTKGINFFHLLYYHPGNILAMIHKYRDRKEFRLAYKSFYKFIRLSMFSLSEK